MDSHQPWCWEAAQAAAGPDWHLIARVSPQSTAALAALAARAAPAGFARLAPAGGAQELIDAGNYDLFCPWSIDRDFYLSLAGKPPQHVLDLGCGTGLLCDAYAAQGHSVTGVDPTAAMLAVARQKPHGGAIEWVQAFSQDYRSDKRFDLIIMTGHAFQVLLEDDDVMAALATVRRHLNPSGRFVFESRNPAIDWAAEWNGTVELTHQGVIVREITQVLSRVGDRVTFEMRYQLPDETLVCRTE